MPKAGCNAIVAGSAVFNAPDYAEATAFAFRASGLPFTV